jgi:hypothetical protein
MGRKGGGGREERRKEGRKEGGWRKRKVKKKRWEKLEQKMQKVEIHVMVIPEEEERKEPKRYL